MKINVTYNTEERPCLSVMMHDKKGKVGYGKKTTFHGENAVLLFEILVNKGLPESLHKKINNFCIVNDLNFDWSLVNFQSIKFIFFNRRISGDEDEFEFSMDLNSIIFYEEESYIEIIRKLFTHYIHNYSCLNDLSAVFKNKNEDEVSNESSEEEFTIPEELYEKIYDFCEEHGLWFSYHLKEPNRIIFEFIDSEGDKIHFDMETDVISMHPDDILDQMMYNLNRLHSVKDKKNT